MTTIAADMKSGVMCSDGTWTDGNEIGPIRKVYRIGDSLVGFAGTLKLRTDILNWLRHGGKCPPAGDVSLLILTLTKLQVWRQTDGYVDVGARFAIGTGGTVARAAMMAGASCQQAVRIATQIDANSGGRVRTYRLNTTGADECHP